MLNSVRGTAARRGDDPSPDTSDPKVYTAQQEELRALEASTRLVAYVRSGGQTGADRAALEAARAADVPICGWCPPGGLAEDLPEPPGLLAVYPELRECEASGYVERTALNVRDAHATLIVSPGGVEPHSGTEMTVACATFYGRPVLVVEGGSGDIERVRTWLVDVGRGLTLNVAGPRASKDARVYDATYELVSGLLGTRE